MPSKSHKQRRYLEAKFGHDWVKAHHFDRVDPDKARREVGKALLKRKGNR